MAEDLRWYTTVLEDAVKDAKEKLGDNAGENIDFAIKLIREREVICEDDDDET